MKKCATCNQTYADDMMFCLSDGTPLIGLIEDIDQETIIRSTPVGRAPSNVSGSGSAYKYLAAALAALFILVLIGGAVAVWILWPRNGTTVANLPSRNDSALPTPIPARTLDKRADQNSNRPTLKEQEDDLERERRRLAEERKKLENDKLRQTETVEPSEPPRYNDPGTSRITFRRGSTGETVSGTISRARSYVLRTMPGQYLSATVRSAVDCVVFESGSASTGFTTGQGDTYLNIKNNCDKPSGYSISVVVR